MIQRFEPITRASCWKDTPQEQWESWIWQQQRRLKSQAEIDAVVPLTPEEKASFDECEKRFKVAITPYYASLIDPSDPRCPIRLQTIPQPEELSIHPTDLKDPLGEDAHTPVPGITHRYPDRVLFYTTHNCPVYCRHCTRKRKVSNPSTAAQIKQIENGLQYIREHPEVRDVLVSGGDPLSNSDDRLEYIFSELRAIPHVDLFRIATRNLVTLPQRITPRFAEMIRKYHPVYVHTHFNHPKECTREAFEACQLLADAGAVLNNQMVLLKGVNDDPETVKELNHRLLLMRVQPYYIFQADVAEGISHFRTPIEKGQQIIDHLRGWTSGMAVPHYVVDLPGGGGKVPVIPDYLKKRSGRDWQFRNYEGQDYHYIETQDLD